MREERDEDEAEREAAAWLSRLNGVWVSTELLDDFYRWRRDPVNSAAFGRIEYLWDRSAALDGDPDIARAVQSALGLNTPGTGRASWPTTRRAVLAGGVGLAGAAGLGWWLRDPRYATAIGEQRTILLNDGSKVTINTDSAIRVAMSARARHVRLERGEAWFEVARDPARPFSVAADGATVTALGTSFSVRREGGSQRIILAEGRVAVRSGATTRSLAPRECVEVRGGQVGPIRSVDIDAETAWRSGRLLFKDTPLGDAVAEVNRYARRPIRLDAPALRAVAVNGSFETGDVETFTTAITALFPVKARSSDDGEIVLSER